MGGCDGGSAGGRAGFGIPGGGNLPMGGGAGQSDTWQIGAATVRRGRELPPLDEQKRPTNRKNRAARNHP